MGKINDNYEAAPIRTRPRRVPPEWIDYNGHLNMSYYMVLFDQCVDAAFEDGARKGDATAQVALGMMHALGVGVNDGDHGVETHVPRASFGGGRGGPDRRRGP